MALDLTGEDGFSMPLGGSLYGSPPYEYRKAQQSWITYEAAHPEAVRALLPPGLEADAEVPVCHAMACWYPWTTFGPYHEAWLCVRVMLDGVRYWYMPFIYTDNEAPLAAGREIWGYPKKLARLDWNWGGAGRGGTMNEQLVFTADRLQSQRIMTYTFAPERVADPAELEPLPFLSLRHLPPSAPGRPPAASELVALEVASSLYTAADGRPELYAGRGSVTFPSRSTTDPWHLFEAGKIISAVWANVDFALPLGTVVKDYLDESSD